MVLDSNLNKLLAVASSSGSAEKNLGNKILNFGATSNLFGTLQTTINVIYTLGIAITILGIGIGALQLIMSAGNKDKYKIAITTLKFSIIGMSFLFFLSSILRLVISFFSA